MCVYECERDREKNKRKQVKLTLKESYSVIIEFRDLAHTAKQFVRHPHVSLWAHKTSVMSVIRQ